MHVKDLELEPLLPRKPTAVFPRTSAPVAAKRRAALREFWTDKLVSSYNTGPFVLASTAVGTWHGVLLDAFYDWLDPLQPRVHQAFLAGRMLSCGYLRFPFGPRQDPPAVAPTFTASSVPGSAVSGSAVAPTAVAPAIAVSTRDREYPGSLAFLSEAEMSEKSEELMDFEEEEVENASQSSQGGRIPVFPGPS